MVTLGCDINVNWSKPDDNGCPLTMYSVYYQEISPQENAALEHKVIINNVLKTHHVLPIRCDTEYVVVEVSAWNVLGQSERSRKRTIKITKSTTFGKFPRTRTLVLLLLGCRGRMGANNKFSSKFEFKKMENSSDHSPSWN